MLTLIPFIICNASVLAIYTGTYVILISETLPNESDKNKFSYAMLAMAAIGLGDLIGGTILSIYLHKIGKSTRSGCIPCFVLTIIMYSLLISCNEIR